MGTEGDGDGGLANPTPYRVAGPGDRLEADRLCRARGPIDQGDVPHGGPDVRVHAPVAIPTQQSDVGEQRAAIDVAVVAVEPGEDRGAIVVDRRGWRGHARTHFQGARRACPSGKGPTRPDVTGRGLLLSVALLGRDETICGNVATARHHLRDRRLGYPVGLHPARRQTTRRIMVSHMHAIVLNAHYDGHDRRGRAEELHGVAVVVAWARSPRIACANLLSSVASILPRSSCGVIVRFFRAAAWSMTSCTIVGGSMP